MYVCVHQKCLKIIQSYSNEQSWSQKTTMFKFNEQDVSVITVTNNDKISISKDDYERC
jgi:PHD/YefM family antitoxin component YafN of YafNO toxin-antitoxin module